MFRRKPKPVLEPKWLIVGLGNPGSEYVGTRHNIGFDVVERLGKKWGIKFDRSKHRARIGTGRVNEVDVAVVKPMTYMNLSGLAIAPLLRDLQLGVDRLLVISDETDLPLGRIRLRATGGSGGHNGHKSIIGAIKTQDYSRIRVGIGRVDKEETIDHVLGRFDEIESREAIAMVERAIDAIECVLRDGIETAMNEFNR